MKDKIRTLIDETKLAARIKELGAQITADYADSDDVVVVPVLKGSFLFAADLVRHIDLTNVSLDFLGCRSYADGTETSGVVQLTLDLSKPIAGKDVILVEDIVDTGLTMNYLLENLETRRPRSIKIASLLHKPARTRVPIKIDYLGFTIDDVFVVGYGLDYGEKLRNLPFIGIFDPS